MAADHRVAGLTRERSLGHMTRPELQGIPVHAFEQNRIEADLVDHDPTERSPDRRRRLNQQIWQQLRRNFHLAGGRGWRHRLDFPAPGVKRFFQLHRRFALGAGVEEVGDEQLVDQEKGDEAGEAEQ